MNKFVELIQRAHQERYSVVISNIAREKIPVAFLSVNPFEKSAVTVNMLRSQGVNITNLITVTPPPQDNLQYDFNIIAIANTSKIQPCPEYILTADMMSARLAVKHMPKCKVLTFGIGGADERPDTYIYEMFMNHLEELQEVYESLIDEESRRAFCGYWLGGITHQFGELVYSSTTHYFTAGFMPKAGDIVIDAGTFDGGTAAKFARLGCKVYGFEMDKKNFEIAKDVAAENDFIVENVGLGSFKHELKYISSGGISRSDPNGNEVAKITTIDAYVGENKIPHVDFIKMDVEGAELDVLRGATTTIARFKPILAISAYHKWNDFWVLMNFIKSIRTDYEFALRHFTESYEDQPPSSSNPRYEIQYSLGLEPDSREYVECVLMAR